MKKLMKNKLIFALVIALVAVIICVAAGTIYMNGLDKAFDSSKADTVNITVEQGSTTGDIGALLEKEGIIGSADAFKYYSKFKGYDSKYQAGNYALAPAMKLSEIAEIIMSGKTNNMTFTIPEGLTIYQIADKLADEGLVDKEKFRSLLVSGDFDADYWFLEKAQKGKNHLEGYLFPETYTVEYGADEETIIRTMLDHFESVFTDKMRADVKKTGMSLNDIMVIASIIERESRVDKERPTVASVIYNRVKEGMPLQMDSTVQYVLGKQKETLTYADTELDSPYNTYTNPGIPPGPIACPGLASIKAAIYPENTDYIYFVVSKELDGTHTFTADYNQFLKDKDAYYKALEAEE